MPSQARLIRFGWFVAVVVVGTAVFAVARNNLPDEPAPQQHVQHHAQPTVTVEDQAKLISSDGHVLSLPRNVAKTMGLQVSDAEVAPPPTPLKLEGTLFLDPNRLTRVHTRFPGEVVAIGEKKGTPQLRDDDSRSADTRPIRFGDEVEKDELLAVVWCKDLGEKKAELVDCLSRMYLDQETAKRLEELYQKGAIPERSLREAERNVESDMIAVSRAESTLRVWRLKDDPDIKAIRDEAARIHKNKGKFDEDIRGQWARVEVRASIEGTVVEKNIAVGDIVDTSLDLFKIADLRQLDVLAHAYEDDIPQLETTKTKAWKIFLKSNPDAQPLSGSFNQIGNIIDPNQHTALVMGWVNNTARRLRIGQFVSAEVELPAGEHEVAVPAEALVDQDAVTYLFVQVGEDKEDLHFARRRVLLMRRRDNLAYIQGKPDEQQVAAGYQGVTPGERVVISGSLELASKLESLEADARVAQK